LKNSALILQNLQIDYLPGGAMEVPDGDFVISLANQLMPQFSEVIATVDWHPANHISFAGNHPWRHIGQTIPIDGRAQELLPFHCVAGSFGALFHPNLNKEKITHKIELGKAHNVDDYSGFYDAGESKDTPLFNYLQSKNITQVFIMGLPLEKAIKNTVLDALKLDVKTFVIQDACKAWKEEAAKKIWKELEKAGAILLNSGKLLMVSD